MNRIAYRFFAQTILLLILYALLSLLIGLKFLPENGILSSLTFPQISTFAASLLDLAVLGGLLGGGIYAIFPLSSPGNERTLHLASWLWSLLIILTLAAGVFNLLLTGETLLSLLKIVVMVLSLASLMPFMRNLRQVPLVWLVGIVISLICTLVGLIPLNDFVLAAAIHTLTSGVNTYIAEVLAAVALAYWLIERFSTVTEFWRDTSLYTVAGLLAIAGGLVTLSTLQPLGLNLGGLPTLTAILVPLLTLIFASHTYLAFSHRNATDTLAAHWAALGVMLILLGIGMLGSLQATVQLWTAGTALSDLQPTLATLAVVAILLGVINQAVYEMRGQPRRVTGLAPFWLVAFGMIGSGLALAGAGLVQVYLERVIGIGFLETQALIAPLYGLWVFGLALMTLGLLLYGLIHRLRRPRFDH